MKQTLPTHDQRGSNGLPGSANAPQSSDCSLGYGAPMPLEVTGAPLSRNGTDGKTDATNRSQALAQRALTTTEQEWLEKLALLFLTFEGRVAKSVIPFAIREVGTQRGWLLAGRWDTHFQPGGALKELIDSPDAIAEARNALDRCVNELPQTLLHSMAREHFAQAQRLHSIGETAMARMEEEHGKRLQAEAAQLI